MRPAHLGRATVLAGLLLSIPVVAHADDYSPGVGEEFPRRVYWGDTHLHSALSNDANVMGNHALTPEQAYRFARGETVTATSGQPVALRRPLDFLVVADHSEYLGLLFALRSGEDLPSKELTELAAPLASGEAGDGIRAVFQAAGDGTSLPGADVVERSTWQRQVSLADAANAPGVFTALVGYEWTSMPGDDNLHRVVVFREGQGVADQVKPFSSIDSDDPEDLWRWLASYETKTGGRVLAIPHNGNLSNGRMYGETNFSGEALDEAGARLRARWEPLMEVTQIKGDSEAHPFLSPNDEFADYGTFDAGNLAGTAAKANEMLRYEYARSALLVGLSLEARTGANPYRFGLIGSTDSHTGLATADEDDFWGKAVPYEPGMEGRIDSRLLGFLMPTPNGMGVISWEQVASGYAAVWATENTREALFDAMLRREVYATTGPRMTVRFFGGFALPNDAAGRPDLAATGYEGGVPMGAVLPARTGDTAPRFLVSALKDPIGANLDRVQIVKGWLDAEGRERERVYDVAWSDARERDASGKLPPVGSTVDLEHATYRNTIGAAELATLWVDPDFDPAQRAFYYVRVLEIPTPRWIVYDSVRLGIGLPEGAELVHQERAYTSPIWYDPASD